GAHLFDPLLVHLQPVPRVGTEVVEQDDRGHQTCDPSDQRPASSDHRSSTVSSATVGPDEVRTSARPHPAACNSTASVGASGPASAAAPSSHDANTNGFPALGRSTAGVTEPLQSQSPTATRSP